MLLGPKSKRLNNINSFGVQFEVFGDHENINIMTGTKTPSTSTRKNMNCVASVPFFYYLKYFETMTISVICC